MQAETIQHSQRVHHQVVTDVSVISLMSPIKDQCCFIFNVLKSDVIADFSLQFDVGRSNAFNSVTSNVTIGEKDEEFAFLLNFKWVDVTSEHMAKTKIYHRLATAKNKKRLVEMNVYSNLNRIKIRYYKSNWLFCLDLQIILSSLS